MSGGIGCGHSSDLVLLWLCCRLAATAPILPLDWEPPYSAGMALKRKKKKRIHEYMYYILVFYKMVIRSSCCGSTG